MNQSLSLPKITDLSARAADGHRLRSTIDRIGRSRRTSGRRLITAGKLNNEITKEFYGGVRTVEYHRSNICSKLGLSGKHALPTFALTHKAEI